jgi:hypothetical protein
LTNKKEHIAQKHAVQNFQGKLYNIAQKHAVEIFEGKLYNKKLSALTAPRNTATPMPHMFPCIWMKHYSEHGTGDNT